MLKVGFGSSSGPALLWVSSRTRGLRKWSSAFSLSWWLTSISTGMSCGPSACSRMASSQVLFASPLRLWWSFLKRPDLIQCTSARSRTWWPPSPVEDREYSTQSRSTLYRSTYSWETYQENKWTSLLDLSPLDIGIWQRSHHRQAHSLTSCRPSSAASSCPGSHPSRSPWSLGGRVASSTA